MKICIWGDSIAWGASDHEMGGWVERLKLYYMKKTNDDVKVYNLGVSADNSGDLLNRFELEAKEREPNVVVFAIGINDSQYNQTTRVNTVSAEKFENNLSDLFKLAKKFTDKIVFVGLTEVDETKTMPIPWNLEIFYDNETVKKYDEIIKNFCEKNKLRYIKMKEVLQLADLPDGLHPNSEGHEKIFQEVLKQLKIEL